MSQTDPPAPTDPVQDPPVPQTDPPTDPPADPAKDGDLGDAGKKALEAERKARRDAEKANKSLADKLKEYEDRDKSELEKAQAAAQEAADRAAKAEAEALRLRLATELQIPPGLHKFLTGTDEDQLRAQIEELKPYLAESKRFQGGGDGGARDGSPVPGQLTQADVKQLFAQKKYAEIEQAREDGQLADLLGTSTST